MIRKEMEYNFHDAVVISCKPEKYNRFSLTLQLYEIYYPAKEMLKVTFSGVYNYDSVSMSFQELSVDGIDSDWNGSRIDTLEYDKNKTSKDLDLYIVIEIDGFKMRTIHCKKMSVQKVKLLKGEEDGNY